MYTIRLESGKNICAIHLNFNKERVFFKITFLIFVIY